MPDYFKIFLYFALIEKKSNQQPYPKQHIYIYSLFNYNLYTPSIYSTNYVHQDRAGHESYKGFLSP